MDDNTLKFVKWYDNNIYVLDMAFTQYFIHNTYYEQLTFDTLQEVYEYYLYEHYLNE